MEEQLSTYLKYQYLLIFDLQIDTKIQHLKELYVRGILGTFRYPKQNAL